MVNLPDVHKLRMPFELDLYMSVYVFCFLFFSSLFSVSGCPLADKTLKSLMAANSQELK